jgi:hypothetical protein
MPRIEGDETNGLTPVKTPGNYHETYDVVNLNYQWVGLRYRLLTHEVSHWLGLWHAWDYQQLKDGIVDIPLQKTYTDMDCVKCPPRRQRPGQAKFRFRQIEL